MLRAVWPAQLDVIALTTFFFICIHFPSSLFFHGCCKSKSNQLFYIGTTGQHHIQQTVEPSFGSVMENVTVIKGRDASFTCVVLNIGPHRVSISL